MHLTINNFAKCHKLSAYRNGYMLNYSDMAKDLHLAVNTVKQYLRLQKYKKIFQ